MAAHPIHWRRLVLGGLLCLASLASAADALPDVDRLLALTRDGHSGALHAALDTLLAGPADAAGRESRLLDYARRLRETPPSPAGRAALGRLLDYRSQVFDPPPDPRAGVRLPRYRVADAARGTLALWQRQAADKALSGLAARLARGLRDPLLLGHTLLASDSASGLALLPRALDLAPADALTALGIATGNSRLASAAVLAVGRLARQHSPARQRLLDWLADPLLGDSAAEALARLAEPALLPALAARYRTAPALRARILSLLTRSRAPGAGALLRQLALDPVTPAELRAKLQPWLAAP